jgi:hypothetical protein
MLLVAGLAALAAYLGGVFGVCEVRASPATTFARPPPLSSPPSSVPYPPPLPPPWPSWHAMPQRIVGSDALDISSEVTLAVSPAIDFAALIVSTLAFWFKPGPVFDVRSAWQGDTLYVEGFYIAGTPPNMAALRAALRAASRPTGTARISVVDFWVSVTLSLEGLTRDGAAAVGFNPDVAAGAALEMLASALNVRVSRISSGVADFTPTGWVVELTAAGCFGGSLAHASAALDAMLSSQTAALMRSAMAGFTCDASSECLPGVTAVLRTPRMRALAVAVPIKSDTRGASTSPPPPPPHLPPVLAPRKASLTMK